MNIQENKEYVLTLMILIIVSLVMCVFLIFIKDRDSIVLFISFIFSIIILTIHHLSSELHIEEDISNNSIIVYKSFFGIESLNIKQINKVIFVKKIWGDNTIYFYDKLGDLIVLNTTIRGCRKNVRDVIERAKDNKEILIDRDVFKFLQIDSSLNNIDKNNDDSELNKIKEKIKKEKNIIHGSINENLIKWIIIALMTPSIIILTIILLINMIIPAIVGIFLILTELF